MSVKVAYFQPTILAIDTVPPVEFSKMVSLASSLHAHPELNDADNPLISIRGGQQIQVYPNELDIDVSWLVTYLQSICNGYMELVMQQAGSEELRMCEAIVTSVWTIQQHEDQYQEMHTHPGGNLSGNIYITAPELVLGSNPSDGQVTFRLPQTRDITKFIINDTWKYTPTPGSVIIFPSHLPHAVYPWKGSGVRTVMAFDARIQAKQEFLNGQP